MKKNLIKNSLATLFVAVSISASMAQVQTDKRLEMIGATNDDRVIIGMSNIAAVTAPDGTHGVNVFTIQSNYLTYKAATGAGNAFAMALVPAIPALQEGMLFTFMANHTITGAATLNVNGLGAVAINKPGATPLAAGEIVNGQIVTVVYNGATFQVISGLTQGINGWLLTGNTLAGTEFMGSLNAQPVPFRSNNLERMRITPAGNVIVNATIPFAGDVFSSYSGGTDDAIAAYATDAGLAVYGQNTVANGIAHYGITSGAGAIGVVGQNTNSGVGVLGFQTGTGDAVQGLATTATGGTGVYGETPNALRFGLWGQNLNASGTGAVGVGNNLALTYATIGSGGAFNGTRVGSYNLSTNTSAAVSSTGVMGIGAGGAFTMLNGGTGVTGTAANSGVGVFAYNSGTAATASALYATTTSTTADAVFVDGGENALWAQTTVANGTGVTAIAQGGTPTGVFAYGVGGDGTGVFGVADNGGEGILGLATNAALGWAVFGIGDLGITGGKFFTIDHPNDPENKMLKHFCTESDEVLNVYRGNVVLDGSGKATVNLPSYFHAVNNDNYSYVLTPIGQAANVYVEQEVAGGSFKIAGGEPGMKVSWYVYAERNDPYFQQYPEKRNVEVEKSATQKGKYFMPELYGMGEDKRIHQIKTVDPAAKKAMRVTTTETTISGTQKNEHGATMIHTPREVE